MSKSRRVFLSMQGNDDFWGNGDRFEEEKAKKTLLRKSRIANEDDEGMQEKYFFKQSNCERKEEQSLFREKSWTWQNELNEKERKTEGVETKRMFGADHNPFEKPEKVAVRAMNESSEAFYNNYRSFFKNRPEVLSLVRDLNESATDNYDNHFIDLYEKTRKSLETFPNPHINQILRRTCPTAAPHTEPRVRNRQAVVVSNFREPDRRLGRYSKYYYHHNVGPEVYSRKVFVGGLPTLVTEADMINFFSRYGRLQVDWPSKHYGGSKSDSDPSVCNETFSPPPTHRSSHLAMSSPPFGQVNPFMSDFPPRQQEPPMSSFGRQNGGGGFSSPGFGGGFTNTRSSDSGGFSNPGSVNPFGGNFGGFSNPGRVSNSGSFPCSFSSNVGTAPKGIWHSGRFSNLDVSPMNDDYDNSCDSGFGMGTRGDLCGGEKKPQHLGYVFLLFEKERSVRDLVAECFEEEEGLFITLESAVEPTRVQIRPWLLADAEFLMDFNVPINTKLVAFIGGVPRPLKAVELAHFFEQTYGNVVCVGIDIDNKFKYPRGSGRVAFSNYDAYVQAITDSYIILDHEDIHKRVEIKPYFFHNQSCEECSGRYHRQHAPFFCPSLECFQYYCEPCWEKMHAHPSRFHHQPVVKGV